MKIALVLLLLALAGPTAAELAEVTAETVVSGLNVPVAVTHPGDGRLFVSQLNGQVRIVEDGAIRLRPFLDLGDRIRGEGGLYSLAFHPDYATNGWFFVHYTEKDNGDSIVARYRVSDDDPDRADAASEAVLLRIPKTEQLHYGGQLHFGPDGYLYVSTGDSTGRGTVADPLCVAQSTASLEGKILRLDVDQNPNAPPHYGLPPDNPFVDSGRGEIWAYGLRNPWRFSFDRATGDLWISDVGQDRREEVNLQPAASGGGENYGWKVMEGNRCSNNRTGCEEPLPACGDAALALPVLEYAHSGGRCSVIGGYVYRGRLVPTLAGRYVYGDFCTGEVWAAAQSGNRWTSQALSFTLPGTASFGEDTDGELYLMTGDTLYRLVDPGQTGGKPCQPSDTVLCLNNGRFKVEVAWDTGSEIGDGQVVPGGTGDSSNLWFFSPNNWEMLIKVLNGCPINNNYWVFFAATTNVGFTVTVTDSETGLVKEYANPLGQAANSVTDTTAFATCP